MMRVGMRHTADHAVPKRVRRPMTVSDNDRALFVLHQIGGDGSFAALTFVLGRLAAPPSSDDLRDAMYKAIGAWVGAVAEPLTDKADADAVALLNDLLQNGLIAYDSARDLFRACFPAPTLPMPVASPLARIAALWWMTGWQSPAQWRSEPDLKAYVAACNALCAAAEFDLAADVLMTAVDDRSPTVHDQLDLWGAYRTQLHLWHMIVGDGSTPHISDPATRMLAVMNLGRAHDNLGHYAQARAAYIQVVAMARAAKDKRTEGQALGNLGLVSHSTGDYQQAIRYYEEAISVAREVGNRISEGRQLGNLGNVYWRMGDYHKALAYQQQRLTLARELHDVRGEGYALSNVANALKSLGRAASALATFEEALAVRRSIGDRSGEATDLANVGSLVYESGGDATHALEYLVLSALLRAEIASPNLATSLLALRQMQEEWPGGTGWFDTAVRRWCEQGAAEAYNRRTWERAVRTTGNGSPSGLSGWLLVSISNVAM